MKNAKGELIMSALLGHATVKDAAASIGLGETTVYTWLRKLDFKAEYDRRRRELVSDTANYLRIKMQEATAVIVELMNDPSVQAQTRLHAARTVFEYSIKLSEQTEILQRIEALEAIADDYGRNTKY